MRVVSAIVALALLTAAAVDLSAGPPFTLARLTAGRMTLVGHRGGEQIEATYRVKQEPRDGALCWHVVWDSSVDRIDTWLRLDGRPLHTVYDKRKSGERVEISYREGGATFRHTKGGATETSEVTASDLIEVLAIDVLLLTYPFEQPREIAFSIINPDSDSGDSYRMSATLAGVEELTVAGARCRAYKIKVELKGLAGVFAPTLYYWYSTDPSHRYLKYEGPDESFALAQGGLSLR